MKPKINFETYPEIYNHWELKFEKNTAFLIMKVDEDKGFFEGYKLKLNSYNLFYQFLKHPFMSFKIIGAIHFEAFRLWIKGIKLVKKKIKIKNNLSLES